MPLKITEAGTCQYVDKLEQNLLKINWQTFLNSSHFLPLYISLKASTSMNKSLIAMNLKLKNISKKIRGPLLKLRANFYIVSSNFHRLN
jgi:hypothetical protein